MSSSIKRYKPHQTALKKTCTVNINVDTVPRIKSAGRGFTLLLCNSDYYKRTSTAFNKTSTNVNKRYYLHCFFFLILFLCMLLNCVSRKGTTLQV